ncbi:MAG TPA: glycosyltransferase family 9 protein [Caldimonas sp.]|nr:glycosyltransferase family 9 protein [Caldimonas sp.]HEX2542308.1 glycosyltransferase family 9 protein [Caldimonas sp.]
MIRLEATLGDNLLNIPFLRAVRRVFPTQAIHLVHHAASAPVYASCPYVDHRIVVTWPMRSAWTLARRLSLSARLFPAGFSGYAYALLPRWGEDLFAPFVAWSSGAPISIGFSRKVLYEKSVRMLGLDSLLTDAVVDRNVEHESVRPLKLLTRFSLMPADAGRMEFWVSPAARAKVAAAIAGAKANDGTRWVTMAPGANLGRRKWPVESFAQVARMLLASPDVGLILVGSENDRGDACHVAASCKSSRLLNFAGNMELEATAAAIATSACFIGNDSGLLHLASAVGVAAVEISCHPLGASPLHPNAPERFGPTAPGSVVLRPRRPLLPCCSKGCSIDEPHCITSIEPEEATQAAMCVLSSQDAAKEPAAR